MIVIKNKGAIEKMRKAGHSLAQIMQDVRYLLKSGISTLEIDSFIEKKILEFGLKPECKGYAGYKYATCISLNDGLVHGIPSDKVILKSGDFVKIDVVASYAGYCADMTRYFFIENVDIEIKRIAQVAQFALDSAIKLAVEGNRISDISACVQKIVEENGFGVVRSFAGHGIGRNLHEEPEIPNFGKPGLGPVLRSGMTLAIEPMITQGGFDVRVMADGWTVKTVDGGIAAHVEDTVLVTTGMPEILTRLPDSAVEG
ncbi:type I methionyl aminopeptidase [Candidatus Dependentiae bacterium]|nr:type I methionyl aminopeptidase [Candidatus Dependentiae bacterium]MBU4387599.1 type I methionyl aminopeptidase [Candidatus Dependentiae bacterium]MCG2756279.1 type I methionyl aminopeptidase [Candidatus Dependentiae bacterium]